MSALIDRHDAALFDLDGVVYLGEQVIPGAAEGIAELRERGVTIGFVTNNASRTPQAVADHLRDLGIPAEAPDVVTSAQAGARVLAERFDAGAPVLVVGAQALRDEVTAAGFWLVQTAAEEPVAVIQGYHPDLPWRLLDEAGYALQAGAYWIATNTDSTRPTDRGLVAGAGAQVGALGVVTRNSPQVAGKPQPPLLQETVRRLETSDPIFVGDRIDTDIDGAAAVDMPSLFVFTGAHRARDVIAAKNRPTHLGADLRALNEPAATVECDGEVARCGQVSVRRTPDGKSFALEGPLGEIGGQLDALRALLELVPAGSDPDDPAIAEACSRLDLLA